MTLEGANNFNETEKYIIYTMNSATTGQYGVVVPKVVNGTLNMLVDLHLKSSFDGVSSGVKTKDDLIVEISDEYKKLVTKYADGMLVMPMIDEAMFKNAVINNDKQKMFDEVKKIGAITSELYKKLTDSGVDKQKIDQKIIIVEKNEDDEKFVVWLKEQMPNFVDGVRYSELSVQEEVVNPFVATTNNDIFGPAPTPSAPVDSVQQPVIFDNIFGDSNVSEEVKPVEVVQPVVPEGVSAPAVSANDIFGTPVASEASTPSQPVVTPAVEQTTVTPNLEQPVTSTPVESVNVTPAVEPKPVSSAALEGTIAFTPIPNHPNNPVEAEEETHVTEKASKGFANLLILLIILVGVTFASIELGKFLYSVYGA